ncbi:17338_t:CDS:2 [Funneliformis geosporum]|uniref:4280_t:CDS:1 n=1 Tax=Funneliformis geosporum TaxID=1117311 RepID=A0A9W4SXX6_9GLOM|nr:17338_t:CDS:2 [Funneliformis geosporum]CAI2185542.1 4280_t:CDS:2 [Funneliformis geosporum]
MNEKENFGKKSKENAKEGYQKTKEVVQEGSHLAATKTSITLSNEEAELMGSLKDKLNKKGFYPSKSEILRAGL